MNTAAINNTAMTIPNANMPRPWAFISSGTGVAEGTAVTVVPAVGMAVGVIVEAGVADTDDVGEAVAEGCGVGVATVPAVTLKVPVVDIPLVGNMAVAVRFVWPGWPAVKVKFAIPFASVKVYVPNWAGMTVVSFAWK